MPQIRKSSPRRRDRRSRSRSRSPRGRRHSSSRSRDHRSRSRDRRRSRSPQRKRSPERRHRSPPRKRSPSPRRRGRSRSRSRSPARKARHSSSPSDRGYIVKRPADSSGKRPGYRSRSPSPVQKRSRDDRSFREESPRDSRRSRRSQSPSTSYGGRMYSDQPSSSKQPLFPAGTSSRKQEIDYVTIVEKGPKREKLDKRFETLEQVAQGAFDFEENITIGIHRGPQHIQLHEDEDIEVNYEFNPKTFKMLFPKKEYHKAIFDRDEIKAFHHDDVLDEEAYVEKRTISIKPVDKPKSRKYGDDFDYKITVGSDREGYGDRRMVHDSGSRSRPSRSSRYEDIPVTVRLDPKPDPRYEKIYKEQQRNEDESLMSERIKRNPNDLRHNLLRRKSDGDRVDRGDRGDRSRDDRGRDDSRREDSRRDAHTLQDARSRIQARREGVSDSRRDRSAPDRSTSDRHRSPPRHDERKKRVTQTSLPDFKNRPEKLKPEPEWKLNPTVTPKGQSYYEHDNRAREDMSFLDRKRFGRGGRFPASRGRGRGGFREPRGRGLPKRSIGENNDVWKHDKFDEIENNDKEPSEVEKTETIAEVKTDNKCDRKDKSDNSQGHRRVSDSSRDRSSRKDSSSNRKESLSSRKESSSSRKESSSSRSRRNDHKESSSREKKRDDDKGSSREKRKDDHIELSSSEKRRNDRKESSSGEKNTNDQKESSNRRKSHEAIEKERMDIKTEEESLRQEVQVEIT